jgi:transcriptional regulator with XRE-family HTH domain
MADPRHKQSDATRSFAASLRELRKNRKASLQQMSLRAGVSRSLISKIERNEVQPSLNVAVRLANALGTTLPEMLRYDEYARVIKLSRREQAVIRNTEQGWERRILSPSFHGATVQVSRLVLSPRVKLGSFPAHPKGSEEHIIVTAGKLQVKLDGTAVVLEAGDSLFFEADRKHLLENTSHGKTEFFVVIKK